MRQFVFPAGAFFVKLSLKIVVLSNMVQILKVTQRRSSQRNCTQLFMDGGLGQDFIGTCGRKST